MMKNFAGSFNDSAYWDLFQNVSLQNRSFRAGSITFIKETQYKMTDKCHLKRFPRKGFTKVQDVEQVTSHQ